MSINNNNNKISLELPNILLADDYHEFQELIDFIEPLLPVNVSKSKTRISLNKPIKRMEQLNFFELGVDRNNSKYVAVLYSPTELSYEMGKDSEKDIYLCFEAINNYYKTEYNKKNYSKIVRGTKESPLYIPFKDFTKNWLEVVNAGFVDNYDAKNLLREKPIYYFKCWLAQKEKEMLNKKLSKLDKNQKIESHKKMKF